MDWDEAVQIAVGEGLTAGINWWVVVATPDGVTGRARLTNADSLDNSADAEWLIASGWQASTGEGMASNDSFYWQYFPHVKWDAAGHERLHAAVAKGFECLDLEYLEPDLAEPLTTGQSDHPRRGGPLCGVPSRYGEHDSQHQDMDSGASRDRRTGDRPQLEVRGDTGVLGAVRTGSGIYP